MFVNYVKESYRPTAFNLFVARILLGVYGLWKLLSYQFERLHEWPQFIFAQNYNVPGPFLSWQLEFLWLEKWFAAVLLVLFIVGWRLGVVTFLLALSLAHMGALHYAVTNWGSTWLAVIYALIVFGLYRDTDALSLDGFRRTKVVGLPDLNTRLEHKGHLRTHAIILVWVLILIATTYFFTGYSKLLFAGGSWLDPEHLALQLQAEAIRFLNGIPPVASLLIEHQWLAVLSSWLTLVLECGFLVAVVLRLPIWPFMIGLAGLHTMILLSMNIFFFDQYILFLLFVPWDKLHVPAKQINPVQVFFDDGCYFCARSLNVLAHTDTAGAVAFVPASKAGNVTTLPADVDLTVAMYARVDGRWHKGYYAFREMMRPNYVLRPLVWLTGLPPVAWIGERVYAYIARNRHTLTSCALPQPSDDAAAVKEGERSCG